MKSLADVLSALGVDPERGLLVLSAEDFLSGKHAISVRLPLLVLRPDGCNALELAKCLARSYGSDYLIRLHPARKGAEVAIYDLPNMKLGAGDLVYVPARNAGYATPPRSIGSTVTPVWRRRPEGAFDE